MVWVDVVVSGRSSQFAPKSLARWGYPNGFYIVVGVLEAIAGVAVVIPRLATYGALLAMAIMFAAALSGVLHGDMRYVTAPLSYFVACGAIAWLRRSNRWQ